VLSLALVSGSTTAGPKPAKKEKKAVTVQLTPDLSGYRVPH